MAQKKKIKKSVNTPNKTPKSSNLKPRWKPGESGNPKGRPKGSLNYSTMFDIAIRIIAKEEHISLLDAEVDIIRKGLEEARKGNFNFYKDLLDRRFGKAKDVIDVNLGKEVRFIPTPQELKQAKKNFEDIES